MASVTIMNEHTHNGIRYFPGQLCEMSPDEAKWYYDNIDTTRKAIAETPKAKELSKIEKVPAK